MNEHKDIEHRKFSYYCLRLIEETSILLARIHPFVMLDEIFALAKYRRLFGKNLDLKDPQTFNEKTQWLKLYHRDPLFIKLADKYAVREYVQERIGGQYLNELLGAYSNVDDIDFEKLPDKFVLKANHASGWNIICTDKAKLDISKTKAKLKKWLRMNYYYSSGEWVYKDIPPKFICVKYLEGDKRLGLLDYKFYCFHGEPKYIQVDVDRFGNHQRSFFDLEWALQPFSFAYPISDKDIPRPPQFTLMKELAGKLSAGIDFCRVDFYNFDGRVIFGEITFYCMAGFATYTPPEYDLILGSLLTLPTKTKC